MLLPRGKLAIMYVVQMCAIKVESADTGFAGSVIGIGFASFPTRARRQLCVLMECLCKIVPGMNADRAWALARRIDGDGSAEVWCGPLEQAELYHQQLVAQGLTMAPVERC